VTVGGFINYTFCALIFILFVLLYNPSMMDAEKTVTCRK